MIRIELIEKVLEACENEYNDIYAKHKNKFTKKEPFKMVMGEEVEEAKSASDIFQNAWGAILYDLYKEKDNKIILAHCNALQNRAMDAICELIQCWAVLERYKPNLT